jgi:hypothetical protein
MQYKIKKSKVSGVCLDLNVPHSLYSLVKDKLVINNP